MDVLTHEASACHLSSGYCEHNGRSYVGFWESMGQQMAPIQLMTS
jgi:hypothetical protein